MEVSIIDFIFWVWVGGLSTLSEFESVRQIWPKPLMPIRLINSHRGFSQII
jgi:hypothetical protein